MAGPDAWIMPLVIAMNYARSKSRPRRGEVAYDSRLFFRAGGKEGGEAVTKIGFLGSARVL